MATRRRFASASGSLLLLAASSLAGCDARDENLEDMGRPAGSIDISGSIGDGRGPGEIPGPVPVPINEHPVEAQVPSAEAPPQVP